MMMESPPFQTFKQINDFLDDRLWDGCWHYDKTQDTIAIISTNHSAISRLMRWNNHVSRLSSGGQWRLSHTMTATLSLKARAVPSPHRSGHCAVWSEIMNISRLAGHYTQHRPTHNNRTASSGSGALFFLFFINVSQIGQMENIWLSFI